MSDISVNLRSLRIACGLSQAELAARVGVTRQSINSIEAGKYVPGTESALRLADALGCRVEEIFNLADRPVEAPVAGDAVPGERVVLGRVGERIVAHPLRGTRLSPDGFVAADGHMSGRGRASLLLAQEQVDRTALIAGCDPSLTVLAAFVSRKAPDRRLVPLHATSEEALSELSRGRVHAGGTHLRDAMGGGECNVTQARSALARGGGLVISYAAWEQGMVVAAGNPMGIHSVADLARRDVRIVNREPGSGSRRLLDDELRAAGVDARSVAGYGNEAPTHMAVARTVASGAAGAGIALRAVASAFGLDFVPLAKLRFDLVIPAAHVSNPAVETMLDVMQSRAFRRELAALPGYDISRTGSTVLRLAA
jgi:molybdate-binding protein/DNA-binding XRE family transcriptional regulator